MSEVENTTGEVKAAAAPKAPVAKIDAAAEKAYAEAAAKAVPAAKPAAPAAKPAAPAAKPAAPAAKAVKAAPAPKTPAAPKPAPVAKKAVPAKKAAAKTVKKTATKTKTAAKLPVKKPVLATKAEKPAAAPKTNPIVKLKDSIMTTANTADITATAKNVVADLQARAKTAYTKGTEFTAEATEFTKANVEAVVESGKIFFAGAQELLKDNVETGKTVIETVTEDAKKVAAVKSPTELMQLQGEIARRNFDALVSFGSKRTEAWVKLYNDAFAPISNRVSVAVEKVKTAA
ncbi:phasin family protein [Erythrobacter sp. CCH5-A1]|jgi:phasin family protein|uniref:phasin family protein n=1 Tax=Erythrobacter sp. CCH5-A1 TaxID=1768792 RepID=UPI00082AB46D|nr:phasin family protein [Erythrobacter sp. CCH5-A1]